MPWFSVGTLAALGGALLAVLVMLGTGFTAIVLAVTHDRVLAEFAGTLRTIAYTLSHGFDSCGWWSSGGDENNPCFSV
jgi:hypothetical protein